VSESGDKYLNHQRLLEESETFPHVYVFKWVGRNSEAFGKALENLESRFTGLSKQSDRLSSGGAHRAVTYSFRAENAGQIIEILRASEGLADLLMTL